ncbi:MAG: relaxase/mobilization nuclease domain-containing protein [Bacteroidales bacterium]|jgi:hypothetical protein|nr:relaxase/mobilization nuclease domain-containing protein [Bacteroidales bacterium]
MKKQTKHLIIIGLIFIIAIYHGISLRLLLITAIFIFFRGKIFAIYSYIKKFISSHILDSSINENKITEYNMISKRIERDKKKVKEDNYRLLAMYVGGYTKQDPDTKILYAWHAGCGADEFLSAIMEAEAVQDMNTRARRDKSYHLMVSFRHEDEEKLTPEVLEDIEKNFANVLGFSEHQRHCGAHKDTAHIHLHIAYNMIHPQKFTIHEPFRDYIKRDKLLRELEKKYGLAIDNGINEEQEPKRDNTKARTVEAHTGQQSFYSYLQERKETLLESLEKAQSWFDLHTIFGKIGVVIKKHNAGCVFKDIHGKTTVKGSSLDRKFSLPQLEKRFGTFEECKHEVDENEYYTAKPLRGAERGELYQEYKKGIDERVAFFKGLAESQKQQAAEIRIKWRNARDKVRNGYCTIYDRAELIAKYKAREEAELCAMYENLDKQKVFMKKAIPYTNWTNFLQHKASNEGNELALAILRSKNIDSKFQNSEKSKSNKFNPVNAQTVSLKEKIARIAASSMTIYDRRTLTAVTQMKLLQAQGVSGIEGFTYRTDIQGIIIFRLRSGGQIRDDGKSISYSAFDPTAAAIASKFAAIRFGRYIQHGTVLTRENRDFVRTF